MHKKTLMQTARRLCLLAAGAGAILVFGASQVMAAPPAPLTCSIDPQNGTATQGVPFTFSANTNGGKGSKTYAWTFSGPASPSTSTNQSQDVTYSATGGPFSVSVHVTDKSGECTAATNVTVTGGGTNLPPAASNDSYNATQGTTLSVGAPGVLGNDTDEAPATLTAVLQTTTTKGTLNLNSNGSFTYNYTGTGSLPTTDSFTYKAREGQTPFQLSNTATVTINIAPGGVTGGTPVGRGDTYATPVGTPLNVTASRVSGVLYNDFDTNASGDPIGNTGLTAQLVSGPTNAASFTLNADGSFNYTPNTSLSDNDNDSFTYMARDGTNIPP